MNIDEFINNFAGQLTNPDPSTLRPDTIINDIEGYSSLESLFILLMVDEIYKVNLTSDDLLQSTTIQDLFDLIKSRM